MGQLMEQLLSNPVIQTAVVALIVVAANALKAYIQKTWPTQAALVESNWCYIQPVVEQAIASAQSTVFKGGVPGGAAAQIIALASKEFANSYRKLERKEPTVAEVNAARMEIAEAVEKAIEG